VGWYSRRCLGRRAPPRPRTSAALCCAAAAPAPFGTWAQFIRCAPTMPSSLIVVRAFVLLLGARPLFAQPADGYTKEQLEPLTKFRHQHRLSRAFTSRPQPPDVECCWLQAHCRWPPVRSGIRPGSAGVHRLHRRAQPGGSVRAALVLRGTAGSLAVFVRSACVGNGHALAPMLQLLGDGPSWGACGPCQLKHFRRRWRRLWGFVDCSCHCGLQSSS
jgi:hypothetical protein